MPAINWVGGLVDNFWKSSELVSIIEAAIISIRETLFSFYEFFRAKAHPGR